MSQIDDELTILKKRLAALEEQKRIEAEKERTNPIKILGEIIDEKKKLRNVGRPAKTNITYTKYARIEEYPIEWLYDQNDKVEFLEPIFNMLKSINERLDALENKNKESSIESLF
jgi:hypothetical protein